MQYGGLMAAGLRLYTFIFYPCCYPAPNMPLRLVILHYLLDLEVKWAVAALQTFGQVFVYGTLTYAEFFCGGADGGAVFDDVHRQITGAFLDVGSQIHHSQHIVLV